MYAVSIDVVHDKVRWNHNSAKVSAQRVHVWKLLDAPMSGLALRNCVICQALADD